MLCFNTIKNYQELLAVVKKNYSFHDIYIKSEDPIKEIIQIIELPFVSEEDFKDDAFGSDSEEKSENCFYDDIIVKRGSISSKTKKSMKKLRQTKKNVVKKHEKALVEKKPTTSTISERNRLYAEADQKLRDMIEVKCHLCNLPFDTFREVNKHFRETHPSYKFGFLKCCGKSFEKRALLLEHIEVHWNPEKFKCCICNDKSYDSKPSLARHMRNMHDSKKVSLTCETCAREFRNASSLKSHMQLHEIDEQKSFECYMCQRPFVNCYLLKRHMSTQHAFSKGESFICDICPKVFSKKNQYVPHMRIHKEKAIIAKGEGLKCPHCESIFGSQYRLNHHIGRVHSKSAVTCKICSKVMKHPDYLKIHMESIHREVNRIPCKICGNRLKNEKVWKAHMERHREEQSDHICSECGHISKTKKGLYCHVKLQHKMQRNLPCQYCSKLFRRKKELMEHEATHTGETFQMIFSRKFCH